MSKVKTYQDLLEEKARLEAALAIQRGVIQRDILQLKQEWKPTVKLISTLAKFTVSGNSSPLISLAVGVLGDVLLKNVVLGRSGWLVRLVVPFLIKNYSTHVLNENGTSIIRKLIDKFKAKSNGKQVIDSEEPGDTH